MTTDSTGKGRPTPKRKDAQAKVKVSSLSPVVTKEQKRTQKLATRQDRVNSRAAYLRGEEGALPLRDRGPERRFVRNYVDARRSIGEYFLPIIFVVLVLTLIQIPIVQFIAIALMYAVLLAAVIDGISLAEESSVLCRLNSNPLIRRAWQCMHGFAQHRCVAYVHRTHKPKWAM